MKRKIVFAAMAVALLLQLLAGCTSTSTSTEEPNSTASASEPPNTATVTAPSEGESTNGLIFPPAETLTLTLFSAADVTVLPYVEDSFDDITMCREIESRFNIHLECTFVAENVLDTQFNILVASGAWPDIVCGVAQSYTGGTDLAIEDGFILDLAPYLETYCPNFMAALASDPYLEADVFSNGQMGCFVTIDEGEYGVRSGPSVRQDWLDALNMDTPETYDEWTAMLEAFKVNYDPKYCIAMHGSGVFTSEFLTSGFGVRVQYQTETGNSSPFYTTGGKDGQVHFGPIEDGCLEYLTLIHQWYEAGYFSSDFVNYTGWMNIEDEVVTDDVGVAFCNTEKISTFTELSETEGFRLVPIASPTKDGVGADFVNHNKSRVSRAGWSISTTSAYPELICTLADWFYTEDGALLTNYGVENEGFVYNENGEPELTDLILKNPDGLSSSAVALLYTSGPVSFGWFNIEKNWKYYTEDMKASLSVWNEVNPNSDSYCYPMGATMTIEEQDVYDSVMNDILTYISENFLAFIMGERDLATFDEFVAEIQNMGIDQAIEVKQAALDRYYGA